MKFEVLKLFGCQGDEHLKFGIILNVDTVCKDSICRKPPEQITYLAFSSLIGAFLHPDYFIG